MILKTNLNPKITMKERITIKSIEKTQNMQHPQPTIQDELERVEILSRFFHRLSLSSLRNLQEIVFPAKDCKIESNV